jgi:serine acetyltransferase
VLRDVPAGALAAGVPAEIVERGGADVVNIDASAKNGHKRN